MDGGPDQPGTTDGQETVHAGRSWVWSESRSAWFPTDPAPYESVISAVAKVWMYHPVLGDWFDPLHFPDETGAEPEASSRAIAAAVRQASEPESE